MTRCFHRLFQVYASYRHWQKPRPDSGRAKPPPWSWRATLVHSVTANENRAFHTPLIYITIFTSSRFDWLLQLRSKSFWRQIDFGLDLSRCWVALWPAVLSRHGSGWVCLGAWGIPSASGGLPPRLLPPFEGGWVDCPAPEAPLTRGMPTGPRAFLKLRARVGYGPAPGPTKKRPCAILARKVGRATNTSADYFSCGPNHFGDRLI